MADTIRYVKTTGTDIERVVGKMEESCKGEKAATIMMACLIIALYFQDPDMPLEKLAEGVKGASEWMALFTANAATTTNPLSMN